MATPQKITTFLWFAGEQALEAAQFYTSLFPGSSIDNIMRSAVETPGNAQGSVLLVSFTMAGQRYEALNGRPPHEAVSNAVSLAVSCDDQAEVDRLWQALTADGGKPIMCGWLKDKFGFAWQITPKRLIELMNDADPAVAKRTMQAMMQMVKLDVATLEAAAAAK